MLLDAHHQPIVIDSVEERFEVDIYHSVATSLDFGLRVRHGLVSRASRAKAAALWVKVRFPFVLHDLGDGWGKFDYRRWGLSDYRWHRILPRFDGQCLRRPQKQTFRGATPAVQATLRRHVAD